MEIKKLELFNESSWTEKEKKKLNDFGFYPHWGNESDYRREVDYGDVIYDRVYKSSPESYYATKSEKEGDRWEYEWKEYSDHFNNFDSLISFFD